MMNYKNIFKHISVISDETHKRETKNKALNIFETQYAKKTKQTKPLFNRISIVVPVAAVFIVIISFSLIIGVSHYNPFRMSNTSLISMNENINPNVKEKKSEEKIAVKNDDSLKKKELVTDKTQLKTEIKSTTIKDNDINNFEDDTLIAVLSKEETKEENRVESEKKTIKGNLYEERDEELFFDSNQGKVYSTRSKKAFTKEKVPTNKKDNRSIINNELITPNEYTNVEEFNTLTLLPKPINFTEKPNSNDLYQIINFFMQNSADNEHIFVSSIKNIPVALYTENFVIIGFKPQEKVQNLRIFVTFNKSVKAFKLAGNCKKEESKKSGNSGKQFNRVFVKDNNIIILIKILLSEASNELGMVEYNYYTPSNRKEIRLSSIIKAPNEPTVHSPTITKKTILAYLIYQYKSGVIDKNNLIQYYNNYFTQKDIDNLNSDMIEYIHETIGR